MYALSPSLLPTLPPSFPLSSFPLSSLPLSVSPVPHFPVLVHIRQAFYHYVALSVQGSPCLYQPSYSRAPCLGDRGSPFVVRTHKTHTHRELCSCINLQRLGVQLFVNICDLGETLWSAVEGGVGMGTIRGLAKV